MNHRSLGATGLHYCLAETDRRALIDDMGWTISGDSRDCPCTPLSWNGGTGTSDVPENCNPGFVPGACNDISLNNATDALTIPANYPANAKSLYNTGSVDILNTATLTLSGATGYGLQNFGCTLSNAGTLDILNPGTDGVRNENGGLITNTGTGVMSIQNTTGIGLINTGTGTTLLNTGQLTISNPGIKHIDNLDGAVLTIEGTLLLED